MRVDSHAAATVHPSGDRIVADEAVASGLELDSPARLRRDTCSTANLQSDLDRGEDKREEHGTEQTAAELVGRGQADRAHTAESNRGENERGIAHNGQGIDAAGHSAETATVTAGSGAYGAPHHGHCDQVRQECGNDAEHVPSKEKPPSRCNFHDANQARNALGRRNNSQIKAR